MQDLCSSFICTPLGVYSTHTVTLKCTPQVHGEQPQESLTLVKCEQYPSALPARAGGTFGTAALSLLLTLLLLLRLNRAALGDQLLINQCKITLKWT